MTDPLIAAIEERLAAFRADREANAPSEEERLRAFHAFTAKVIADDPDALHRLERAREMILKDDSPDTVAWLDAYVEEARAARSAGEHAAPASMVSTPPADIGTATVADSTPLAQNVGADGGTPLVPLSPPQGRHHVTVRCR